MTPHGRQRGRQRDLALTVLLAVGFVAFWQWAVWFFAIAPIIIPGPIAVFQALASGITSGELPAQFMVTFGEVLLGFIAGATLGLVWGVVVGLFPLMEKTLYPYIVAFQTVPKVAIAPIIVIWFGYGMSSKIVITATIAFFPVLANTIVGLRAAPRDQIELLIAFTASPWQIFWKLRVRQALPYILVGLDVAIVLSVIGAIVGEFVGAKAGLGYLILQRNFSMDMAGTFAILILLSAIGVGLHALVSLVRRHV